MTLAVEIRNANGEVVKVVELPDPREAFCRSWAEIADDGSYAVPVSAGGERDANCQSQ